MLSLIGWQAKIFAEWMNGQSPLDPMTFCHVRTAQYPPTPKLTTFNPCGSNLHQVSPYAMIEAQHPRSVALDQSPRVMHYKT